ncbi:hypothetical protein [Nonomuraea jiangxiensis]|uniref:hypothetical protein n=1 Tax=Nonomuraea jiangxiensis TaxID=633440 RepID=UPI00115FC166|nr:hypothetical protein [Nonomuraea jiangxiensis]
MPLDKLAGRYLAGVTIASLMLWLRQAELSDTPWQAGSFGREARCPWSMWSGRRLSYIPISPLCEPGGSIRSAEVHDTCRGRQIALARTDLRLFHH